jgi:hypothetical protein
VVEKAQTLSPDEPTEIRSRFPKARIAELPPHARRAYHGGWPRERNRAFIAQDGVNSVVIDAKVVDLGMLILVDCFVSRLDGRRWPVQL